MHWVNRILLAALVAGVIAFWPERLELTGGSADLERVGREREELQAANAALREEIRLMRAEIQALKHDPREVARIAREDLNLVRPGEAVFEVERPGSDAERGQ
ncbi:MAG: septum formation initiator family protein [Myxococcales bacterium]|nr:septum formation initiator family protein [Myxococcales bacterium]MCB9713410.1 septum formation initiator family protein [Myxococcales bacterium]